MAGVVDYSMIFLLWISVKFNYQYISSITEVNNVTTNKVLSFKYSSFQIYDLSIIHNGSSSEVKKFMSDDMMISGTSVDEIFILHRDKGGDNRIKSTTPAGNKICIGLIIMRPGHPSLKRRGNFYLSQYILLC